MGDLSKNFNRSEFSCKGDNCCCHSAPVHPALIDGLQFIRDICLSPLIVLSGFRCKKHNTDVGGVMDSLHTLGMAADIMCKADSIGELVRLALGVDVFRNGGIGVYPTWIHLDVRETGRAMWDQR